MGKKRIAIINQRYGINVNGGSEYYTRMLAEHLANEYQIEVLTTCAENYTTWENVYPQGKEEKDGIRIRRFPVRKIRHPLKFRILSKAVRILPFESEWLEQIWAKEQGPYAPELIDYIKESQNEYDVFLFVTYLYYLTLAGLPKVAEKSILIPTAHDEPYIYFKIYKKVFTSPRAIVYLTEEEKKFVNRVFHNQRIRSVVAGMGIEVPQKAESEQFRKKYNIAGDYLIYIGRIDVGKNCCQMFNYFMRYKRENLCDLKLVLVGKSVMDIPVHPDIIYAGYVEEEIKYGAIKGARALWMPSEYESLSIVVLEAMALGVAVIVNGTCEVLKGHCQKSGSGGYYENYIQFKTELERYCFGKREEQERKKAQEYVRKNYSWDTLLIKYKKIIDGDI